MRSSEYRFSFMDIKIKVGVVIINNQNQILLLKEKTENRSMPLWSIVKGTYGDCGQESLFEAAVRECVEEAGVETELICLLGCRVAHDYKAGKIRVQFNFLAKIFDGIPALANLKEQQSRGENINELKWFSKESLASISSDKFISLRAYNVVQDWLSGKSYPLDVVKVELSTI